MGKTGATELNNVKLASLELYKRFYWPFTSLGRGPWCSGQSYLLGKSEIANFECCVWRAVSSHSYKPSSKGSPGPV